MSSTEPVATRLADYAPPAFLIDEVDLDFELGEGRTLVRARLAARRNPAAEAVADLVLDGRGLDTRAVRVDGESVSGNRVEMADEKLTVRDVPDAFVLETEVAIRPGANKSLEGLYASSGNLCTQCEAEGFRKITWFLDRPDVMARYRTRIVADLWRYPVMLSNGNDVERALWTTAAVTWCPGWVFRDEATTAPPVRRRPARRGGAGAAARARVRRRRCRWHRWRRGRCGDAARLHWHACRAGRGYTDAGRAGHRPARRVRGPNARRVLFRRLVCERLTGLLRRVGAGISHTVPILPDGSVGHGEAMA